MDRHLVLDTGPLGIATKPPDRPDAIACVSWLDRLTATGWSIILPEIADYELRRQLLLNGNGPAVRRLNLFGQAVRFEWIDRPTMRKAAQFWADVRRVGRPTADRHALDGDCILAAQASLIAERHGSDQVIIATTNVGHLGRFAGIEARYWERIGP